MFHDEEFFSSLCPLLSAKKDGSNVFPSDGMFCVLPQIEVLPAAAFLEIELRSRDPPMSSLSLKEFCPNPNGIVMAGSFVLGAPRNEVPGRIDSVVGGVIEGALSKEFGRPDWRPDTRRELPLIAELPC